MTKALKLVRVIWEDITVVDDGTWVDRKVTVPAEPLVFDSVGWLLESTTKHIVLSGCVGLSLMAPREVIPRGVIKHIVEFDIESGKTIRLPRRKKAK